MLRLERITVLYTHSETCSEHLDALARQKLPLKDFKNICLDFAGFLMDVQQKCFHGFDNS